MKKFFTYLFLLFILPAVFISFIRNNPAPVASLMRNNVSNNKNVSSDLPQYEYYGENSNSGFLCNQKDFKVIFPSPFQFTDFGVRKTGKVSGHTLNYSSTSEGYSFNIHVTYLSESLDDYTIKLTLDDILRTIINLDDNNHLINSKEVKFLGHRALEYEYYKNVIRGDVYDKGYFKGLYFIDHDAIYGITVLCLRENKSVVYAKYYDFIRSFSLY